MTTTSHRGLARIGVLVPYTNVNLEPDMCYLAPEGVSLHFARLGGYDIDEIPDNTQMAGLGASDLDEPLRLILGARPHVIIYGCTSATLTHGPSFDRDLAAQIRQSSDVATITAAGALINALKSLGATRVGFASPYVGTINRQAVDFLAEEGIETVQCADIGCELGNYGQGELRPEEVYNLGLRADSGDAQAIVLSCTDMRSVEVIDRLEMDLGKPVICSNQALMHQALTHLSLTPAKPCGRLMRAAA